MDSLVLLRTGFSTRWPGAERYLGTTLRGDEGAAREDIVAISEYLDLERQEELTAGLSH